jgi:hypothetical protein
VPPYFHPLVKYPHYKNIVLTLPVKNGMLLVIMVAYTDCNFWTFAAHQWRAR